MTTNPPIKSPFLPYFTDFLPAEDWETFPDTKHHEEATAPENENGAQQSDTEQPPHAIKQD